MPHQPRVRRKGGDRRVGHVGLGSGTLGRAEEPPESMEIETPTRNAEYPIRTLFTILQPRRHPAESLFFRTSSCHLFRMRPEEP